MTRARWFALVVALQALVLLAWAGYHEWNRRTAPTILLETAPVDPRDLLRGDYLTLAYKISRVPPPANAADRAFPGREIWVSLRRNGRVHEAVATSWSAPAVTDPGTLVVRGRLHLAPREGDRTVQVDYGIEKFFVPEGQGQPRFKEMLVEATVSPRHELAIKHLLIDGRPFPR